MMKNVQPIDIDGKIKKLAAANARKQEKKQFPPMNRFRRSASRKTEQNKLDFTSKNYHSGSDSSRALSINDRRRRLLWNKRNRFLRAQGARERGLVVPGFKHEDVDQSAARSSAMAVEMTRTPERIKSHTRPDATSISGQPEPVSHTAPAAANTERFDAMSFREHSHTEFMFTSS